MACRVVHTCAGFITIIITSVIISKTGLLWNSGYCFFHNIIKDYVCFLPAIPSVLLGPPFQTSPWLYPHHKIWLENLIYAIYSLNFSLVLFCSWKCFFAAPILPVVLLSYFCSFVAQVRSRWQTTLYAETSTNFRQIPTTKDIFLCGPKTSN